MKIIIGLFSVLSFFLFDACGGDSTSQSSTESVSMVSKSAQQKTANEKVEHVENRQLIKRGRIRFQTNSIKKTKATISKAIQEHSAYVSKENQHQSGDNTEYSIELRVPAAQFDSLLKAISATAKKVDYQNIDVDDVTEEFIDVESRIKTKKELEERYKGLLPKAKNVEEILRIERELGTLRSDIESFEGRLNYLKNQVSLSTLNVVFYENTTSDFNFFGKIGRSFQMGWKAFLSFIVGLVSLWPFILFGLLLFVLIRKFNLLNIFKRKNK